MQSLSLPIANTIRESVATLLTFAFSRRSMEAWAESTLQGEFGQLRQTMFELPAHRAERACLELAILVRYLDDERRISDMYRGQSAIDFGVLHKKDGSVSALDLRDVANKMIHAAYFEWDLSRDNNPFLIAVSREPDRWTRADINISSLCVVCGSLVS